MHDRPRPTTGTGRTGPGAPTAGIDWASTDHAVAVVDRRGNQLERFTSRTPPGLRELVRRLRRAGVVEVAIERPDGPVVDALLEAELEVVVIAPNQLKNLRSRYGVGRQQGRPVRRLRPGRHPAHRPGPAATADPGQRRHHHAADDRAGPPRPRHGPGRDGQPAPRPPADHVPRCDRPVPRHRLRDQPAVPDPLPQPGQGRLALTRPGSGTGWPLGRLQPPGQPRPPAGTTSTTHPRGTTGDPSRRPRPRSPWRWSPRSQPCATQIKALEDQIADQLAAHPDAAIFTSLPKSGTVRAARLLAEIGDARGRFPTPEALACLAGAAPSTRQSGKVKVVTFRWAVDKQLRGAVIDFAGDSHHANPWAADLYQRARARGHDHPHAVRILARAWLHIIWRCWQDHVPYDPDKHRALQRLQQQAA